MGCDVLAKDIFPATELSIEGKTNDSRILKAINDAGNALKQAGVSRVKILDWGDDGPIEIMPLGGNRNEVNKSLSSIKEKLQAAGYHVNERPAFRCADSSNELRVSRQGPSR